MFFICTPDKIINNNYYLHFLLFDRGLPAVYYDCTHFKQESTQVKDILKRVSEEMKAYEGSVEKTNVRNHRPDDSC